MAELVLEVERMINEGLGGGYILYEYDGRRLESLEEEEGKA
ncbi:hypothetical protein ACGTN9_10570 [Halobacillus sp. MO56]